MGGRGASSSATTNTTTKSLFNNSNREQRPDVRVRASNVQLNNKKSVIDFVKQQTKIDLNKAVDEDRFSTKSRTYLDIDSRKLSINELNTVRRLLQYDKGLRFESNGAYNYAIYYKKNRK